MTACGATPTHVVAGHQIHKKTRVRMQKNSVFNPASIDIGTERVCFYELIVLREL